MSKESQREAAGKLVELLGAEGRTDLEALALRAAEEIERLRDKAGKEIPPSELARLRAMCERAEELSDTHTVDALVAGIDVRTDLGHAMPRVLDEIDRLRDMGREAIDLLLEARREVRRLRENGRDEYRRHFAEKTDLERQRADLRRQCDRLRFRLRNRLSGNEREVSP